MKPVVIPSATIAKPAAPVAPVQLQLGQTINGRVLATLDAGQLRLQFPGGVLDVATDIPLAPGMPVELAVTGTAANPKLVITPVADAPDQIQATAPDAAVSSVASIIRDAAARQGGLAALYADLEAVVTESNAGAGASAPQAVVAAARQLLAMRLDLESGNGVDANDIKAAILRAGLAGGTEGLRGERLPVDLGTALKSLRLVLQDWFDAAGESPSSHEPLPQSATARPQAAPRNAVPMPPYRGAPTMPQAPAAPSLAAGASPREQAEHLLDETDAAIARHTLLQIASLTGDAAPSQRPGASPASLMFDIPLATNQGTAVAQIVIEPDERKSQSQGAERVWRANFSLDFEPLGPVHVRVTVAGERATVMMNAERPASAQRLSASLPMLEAGLRGVALEPGELRCQEGASRPQAAAPGMFVDQAT